MRGYAKYFLFFIACLYNLFLSAQPGDSLLHLLKETTQDSLRCKILVTLIENESNEAIWPAYNVLLKNTALKNLRNKTLPLQQKIFFLNAIAEAFNNDGYLSDNRGDNVRSLRLYRAALFIRTAINNKPGIAATLNNLGYVAENKGDIPIALEYYHQSLNLREELHDSGNVALLLNYIGFIFKDQQENTKALEYFNKGRKIHLAIGYAQGVGQFLNNIGLVYNNLNNPDSAEKYFSASLKIREKINDKMGIPEALNNLAHVYREKKEFKKAMEYFERALKMHEENNYKEGVAYTLNNMASLLAAIGKEGEALPLALKSFELSKQISYPTRIKASASTLSTIYRKTGNYKGALEMTELHLHMRDSLSNEQTRKASVKKQFQYLYEKKAAADSVKNGEEKKVKDAQLTAQSASLKQEKTQRYALYAGLIMIAGFLLFVINRFRITRRQKRIIELQKVEVDAAYEKLHEKNKEIIDSINYASRIQRALITSEKYIARNLKKLIKN